MSSNAPTNGPDVTTLKAAVADVLPGVRADLEALVRIPSVSASAFDQAHVAASAEHVAGLLRGTGLDDVHVLRATRRDGSDGAPAVVARRSAPTGACTAAVPPTTRRA